MPCFITGKRFGIFSLFACCACCSQGLVIRCWRPWRDTAHKTPESSRPDPCHSVWKCLSTSRRSTDIENLLDRTVNLDKKTPEDPISEAKHFPHFLEGECNGIHTGKHGCSLEYLYSVPLWTTKGMADLPNYIPNRPFFTFHNHLMNLVWVAQDRDTTIWISTICSKGTCGGMVNYM